MKLPGTNGARPLVCVTSSLNYLRRRRRLHTNRKWRRRLSTFSRSLGLLSASCSRVRGRERRRCSRALSRQRASTGRVRAPPLRFLLWFVVSGFKLAVAADGDLRGGRARPSVLRARAAVAGLGAARVALLDGAVGGALGRQGGRVLLQPEPTEEERRQGQRWYGRRQQGEQLTCSWPRRRGLAAGGS